MYGELEQGSRGRQAGSAAIGAVAPSGVVSLSGIRTRWEEAVTMRVTYVSGTEARQDFAAWWICMLGNLSLTLLPAVVELQMAGMEGVDLSKCAGIKPVVVGDSRPPTGIYSYITSSFFFLNKTLVHQSSSSLFETNAQSKTFRDLWHP